MLNFELNKLTQSIIKVIGVGGGGSNAVNQMFLSGIKDVKFVICNTDAQALYNSPVENKIQLGKTHTKGLGAGNNPEVARNAAEESKEDILKILEDETKMVFITAGMGGGTGTGAAPVIAEIAKSKGILTVGIVTIPFLNEGKRRIQQALKGIEDMKRNVDCLLIINNEKIRDMYGDLTLTEAFSLADNILTTAAKGIAEIITIHGFVNVDFADVDTVMRQSGVAIMGTGKASGEGRSNKALNNALHSPLLNNNDIIGAKNILLNITSGNKEITMKEIGEIIDQIQSLSGNTADLIWGNSYDPMLEDSISVTVIATGFQGQNIPDLLIKEKGDKLPNWLSKNLVAHSPWDEEKNNKNSRTPFKIHNIEDKEDDLLSNIINKNTEKDNSFDDTPKELSGTIAFYAVSSDWIRYINQTPAYKRCQE